MNQKKRHAVLQKFYHHKTQILILFLIFIFYLFNGIGALDLNLRSGLDINFNNQIILAILSNTISNPGSIQSLTFILMLFTGFILCFYLPVLTPMLAALLTLFITIPHLYLYFSSNVSQTVLPLEYSLLIILILFSMNALLIYFIETHSKNRILQAFGQFVPLEVVNEICKNPEQVNMDGESRIMTVFFCDLQDFSNVAEQLNPKQLSLLLNDYFDAMTEILFHYGGTIDKYIGDSIMAFWGAPIMQQDHAQNAVLASLDMNKKISELSEVFIKRGWPGPKMGVGINTGRMSVGNMGSKYRIAYTVIGDSVNLASRIESLTRTYRVPILVSESTKNESADVVFREIDKVQVKGKYNVTRIFQPLCRQSDKIKEMDSWLNLHEKAIHAYMQEDYQIAKNLFGELKIARPEDAYYAVMLKKVASIST